MEGYRDRYWAQAHIKLTAVPCCVSEEAVLSTQTVSRDSASVAALLGFESDSIHFGVTLHFQYRNSSISLDYGEACIATAWRMAMLFSSLQRFRIGGQFAHSTPDDLRDVLESDADGEAILRLQGDFAMENLELHDLLGVWEGAKPDLDTLLAWLELLPGGSSEQDSFVSVLCEAVRNREIDSSPESLTRLESYVHTS